MRYPNLHATGRKLTVQLLGETIVKEFKKERELQKFLESCKDRHLAQNPDAKELPKLRGKLYTLEYKYRYAKAKLKLRLEPEIKLIEGKILAIQSRWAEVPPMKVTIENMYP